jgi:hypothetical protein
MTTTPYQLKPSGSVRQMEGEEFDVAVGRLRRYGGQVALSWAASLRVDPPELIAVTARAALTASDINWAYSGIQLRSETISPDEAAARLVDGRVTHAPGPPALSRQQGGNAFWYTTRVDAKMTAALDSPSYYYTCSLMGRERLQNFRFDQPLFGPGLPYFPRASDAILETLYGVTRDQGRREPNFDLLIELPYTGASIQSADYAEPDGLVVLIGEAGKGSAVGHSLHAAWKLDRADRVLSRNAITLDSAGPVIVPIGAPPYFLSLGLVDPTGSLVDSADAYRTGAPDPVELSHLPPQAVAEALDHLDSSWRNAFGSWLFIHAQMTAVGGLSLPATTRADFESRLSYLADILRSARVPDRLLNPKIAETFREDASLGRLKAVLQARLPADDVDEAMTAIQVLDNARRLRVALQHLQADDLPIAMARLALPWPGDWGENWERLRHHVVGALTDVRRSVTSLVDAEPP